MIPTFRAGDIKVSRIPWRIQYEALRLVRSECSVAFGLGRIARGTTSNKQMSH
ncbi:uncharacterized protein EI90DRAFT_3069663 [Cantharellus anzutake]|uniref:uncharacterized protein n=1 Tax=Cantharellus anzutake TaxID=1750568 RepID=UPI00190774CE|nr:uncharacterized protein EI90DRAFT_3069663 [Cantharellus anzutake]KAF8326556.1 hypothetical protein EI90DRAFT_3069663 [Cantharellus anzutake]